MSSVGQRSIKKFGGWLRGSIRSSPSLAEKVSEFSDKHEVRDGVDGATVGAVLFY